MATDASPLQHMEKRSISVTKVSWHRRQYTDVDFLESTTRYDPGLEQVAITLLGFYDPLRPGDDRALE